MFDYTAALEIVKTDLGADRAAKCKFQPGCDCVTVFEGLATSYWIVKGEKIIDVIYD